MKTFKITSFLALFMTIAICSFAQKRGAKESIPVSGNCGMCKGKIEKAAKQAGASDAEWNAETQELTVKYASTTTNAAKIQQAVAAVGYDTRDVKASDEAYDKLHGCCKYERKELKKEAKPEAGSNKLKADDCNMACEKTTSKVGKGAKSCCGEAH
jgi:copper chaperone CopZ